MTSCLRIPLFRGVKQGDLQGFCPAKRPSRGAQRYTQFATRICRFGHTVPNGPFWAPESVLKAVGPIRVAVVPKRQPTAMPGVCWPPAGPRARRPPSQRERGPRFRSSGRQEATGSVWRRGTIQSPRSPCIFLDGAVWPSATVTSCANASGQPQVPDCVRARRAGASRRLRRRIRGHWCPFVPKRCSPPRSGRQFRARGLCP